MPASPRGSACPAEPPSLPATAGLVIWCVARAGGANATARTDGSTDPREICVPGRVAYAGFECDVLNSGSISEPYSCPVAVSRLPGRDIFGRGIYLQPDKQIIGLGWAWHEKIEPASFCE